MSKEASAAPKTRPGARKRLGPRPEPRVQPADQPVGVFEPRPLTEKQERVIAALRNGAFVEQAASFAKVARTVVYRWIAKGQADLASGDPGRAITRNATFAREIERASDDAELRATFKLTAALAAPDASPRDLLLYLKHRYPSRWNPAVVINAEVRAETTITHAGDERRTFGDSLGTMGVELLHLVARIGETRLDDAAWKDLDKRRHEIARHVQAAVSGTPVLKAGERIEVFIVPAITDRDEAELAAAATSAVAGAALIRHAYDPLAEDDP